MGLAWEIETVEAVFVPNKSRFSIELVSVCVCVCVCDNMIHVHKVDRFSN